MKKKYKIDYDIYDNISKLNKERYDNLSEKQKQEEKYDYEHRIINNYDLELEE